MKKVGSGANIQNQTVKQKIKMQKGATPVLSENEVRSLVSFRDLRIGFSLRNLICSSLPVPLASIYKFTFSILSLENVFSPGHSSLIFLLTFCLFVFSLFRKWVKWSAFQEEFQAIFAAAWLQGISTDKHFFTVIVLISSIKRFNHGMWTKGLYVEVMLFYRL